MIAELCDQLLHELIIVKSPIVSSLQPGNSKEITENLLKEANINLVIPDEVYSLYGWRNGITEDDASSKDFGEISLFTLGIFTPLNFSIDSYKESAIVKGYWAESLIPLFESGGGDYFLIDTHEKSITYKMILFYSPSNPYIHQPTSIFDSLDSLLTNIIECYREKAYYFSPDSPYK
jgi:SMI1 / KNR4 family (SUKH-1)